MSTQIVASSVALGGAAGGVQPSGVSAGGAAGGIQASSVGLGAAAGDIQIGSSTGPVMPDMTGSPGAVGAPKAAEGGPVIMNDLTLMSAATLKIGARDARPTAV